MRNAAVVALLALPALPAVAGCGTEPSSQPGNVTTAQYIVDAIELPSKPTQFADDLDGTGRTDNQLAVVLAGLAAHGDDGTALLPDMLKRCTEVPILTLSESAPGVLDTHATHIDYRGAAADDEPVGVGGFVDAGRFVSERTRSMDKPVAVSLRLPIFADADPVALPIVGFEIELQQETAAGSVGYRATLHGASRVDEKLLMPLWKALLQMVTAKPADHPWLIGNLDADHDGQITFHEFSQNATTQTLLAPDVHLYAGNNWAPGVGDGGEPDSISMGLGIHLRPCDAKCCPTAK